MSVRRALLVGTKPLYPADDGKKAVLHGFITYLVERLGAKNVCYATLGIRPTEGVELPCQSAWIRPPGRLRQVFSLMEALLPHERRSMQEALFHSPETRRQLAELITRQRADLVILDTLRVGQLLEDAPADSPKRILYMDDLFHLRYRAMLDASTGRPEHDLDPSGTFAQHLPAFARALIRVGPVKRALLDMEMRAIERRELLSPGRYDACLLINPREADALRARTAARNIFPVKPVLYPRPCPVRRQFDGEPRYLLFGTLRNPAHRLSVAHFLRDCMPRVVRELPEVRIRILGAGVDDALIALARRYGDHVDLAGYVESIDEEMRTACAMLVPLHFGGGLRLKTLTAFYYGLPVITTVHGVHGLDLDDGAGFIREDDPGEFIVHMRRLLDHAVNNELSARADSAFRTHYAKEVVYAEYDRLFGLHNESRHAVAGNTVDRS